MIHRIRIFALLAAVMAVMAAGARETLMLQRQAAEGDKDAMYTLAEGYYYGNDEVRRDYDKAFYWYKKAADNGHVGALRDMGYCYLCGYGVKVSYKKAWECFEKAQKKGDAQSAYYMSQMYKEGMHGKKEDADKAYIRQLVKASDMGSEDAMYEWGMMHYQGSRHYGIPQNKRGGASLILDAADRGSADALLFAGRSHREGINGVRRDYDKAFGEFTKAAELGNVEALYDLGICYLKGEGTPQDYHEAYKYFKRAEEKGVAGATRALGDMYANGADVSYNPDNAMRLYRKAEADGDKEALLSQAMLMIHSEGSAADADKAFRIFSGAAADDNARGFAGLGDCYLEGLSVPQSDAKAFSNYNKAFINGSVHAAAQIGNMYYTGSEATPRDYEKAMKYFRVFLADPLSVPRQVRGLTYRHIGECYRFGRGVAQDNAKAGEYTRKAYEDGQQELKMLLDDM